MLHLVLQVAEGQRLRGQFTVGGVGAGNRTAHQVYVAGIDVVAAITGEQAREPIAPSCAELIILSYSQIVVDPLSTTHCFDNPQSALAPHCIDSFIMK